MLSDVVLPLLALVMVFVSFAGNWRTAEIIALGAAVALTALGYVSTTELYGALGNPAVILIASMFVLSAALEETGVIERITDALQSLAKTRGVLAVALVLLIAWASSFFINNTSVVIIMTPIAIALAQQGGFSSGKLLIPLSYAAILGGTCTLVGSSTNILVNGVAMAHGFDSFGLFDMTVPAILMSLAALVLMLVFGRFMLPRTTPARGQDGQSPVRFIVEIHIPEESWLIGKTPVDLGLVSRNGVEFLEHCHQAPPEEEHGRGMFSRFLAFRRTPAAPFSDKEKIKAGDRLRLFADQRDVSSILRAVADKTGGDAGPGHYEEKILDDTVSGRLMVGANSLMAGRKITEVDVASRYGVLILGICRNGGRFHDDIKERRLRRADILLVQGSPAGIQRLAQDMMLMSLDTPAQKRPHDRRSYIAVGALAFIVIVGVFGFMPLELAALAGACFLVLSKCLTTQAAYRSLHPNILLLICGMLVISKALENVGLFGVLANHYVIALGIAGPIVAISGLYLLTSTMTEFFSNNASAIIMAEIALKVSEYLHQAPEPFIAAVMLAASASFATPIGYQTNLYVYNAGNYRFSDFLKVGIPMNILMWLTATLVIPWHWGLWP